MAGPAGTKLNLVSWHFTARHGHEELPQESHLTAEWRGRVIAGERLSFLTVLVPLSEGTAAPPDDLKLSIEGGHATVKRGAFTYEFPVEQ